MMRRRHHRKLSEPTGVSPRSNALARPTGGLRTAALMLLCVLMACVMGLDNAKAQVLAGPWVTASQERIDKLRKADLRVLVLDAKGVPVKGASVKVTQRGDAFAWGVALPPSSLSRDDDDKAVRDEGKATDSLTLPAMDGPVWRCFNALDLDPVSQWAKVQPEADKHDTGALKRLVDEATKRGLQLRWGGVMSADLARQPAWIAQADTATLRAAMTDHLRQVTRDFGRDCPQFEPLTQTLDQPAMLDKLGLATLRKLHQQARVAAPAASLGIRIDDAFHGERLREAVRHIAALREAFVPIDHVALEVRLSGTIVEAPLTRGLDWIGELNLPVVIVGLQVSGPSEAAAAINLETVLRVFYAHPSVKGVYLADVTAPPLADANAALLDAEGQPTSGGKVVEGLLRDVWWTDTSAPTDDLGNIHLRIFTGLYDLKATLPDGSVATTQARLTARGGGDENMVVMQVEATVTEASIESLR